MSTVYTFPSWPFGELVCKLGEFTVSLSLGVSVFTLTALSAERYMVIVHPMTAVHRSAASGVSSSLLHAVLVAAGIWVLSAALASVELVASPVLVPGLAAGLDPPPRVVVELVAARVSGGPVAVCHAYPDEWGENYVSFHVIFRFLVYFALTLTFSLTLTLPLPRPPPGLLRAADHDDLVLLRADGSHVD